MAESKAFLDGAYRLHRNEDVARFTALAVDAFPKFEKRITCFGADWLGRQFATDEARVVNGDRQVLLLEPGTGEALEIPVGFTSFHTTELVQQPDAIAVYNLFKEWLAAGGKTPEYGQCVGYKKPLYLGGEDVVSNLDIGDFEVYWSITAQLLAKVRHLPLGTRIGSISLSD